jgi:hypothetical protein
LRRISASEAARIEAARVDSARAELARHQQAAAHRRLRMRAQNSALAVVACLALAAILAVGFVTVDVAPASKGAPGQAAAAVDRFIATRTGIVRVGDGRRDCRQVDFNNETGRFSNEMRVSCDDASAADLNGRLPKSEAGNRFEAIRGSFVKK